MIILISAQEPKLESPLDARFGRCPWFIKYDTETKKGEGFENPGLSAPGGAGIAAAQFVIDQKADLILSGDFGPNAADALRAANIGMYLFNKDISTVQQAVDYYLQGKLLPF